MAVRSAQKAAETEEKAKAENTTVKAEKAETGADKKAEGAEKATLVYIGPQLPKGKLKTNKIMIGTEEEIKAELKEVLSEYPLVEKMLVPIEQLAEKKDRAKTPGNIMNKYYSDIMATIAANEAKEA